MPFLFIGSTGNHAGQSLMTWSIALRLVERGLKVGFMKPFGSQSVRVKGRWADHDAFLFKRILKLREPLAQICPYLLPKETCRENQAEKILKEMNSVARELSMGKDILLIMGSSHIFYDETIYPAPDISLIKELRADSLLIDRFRKTSRSMYSILLVRSMLKEKVKGVILNRVPDEKLKEIQSEMLPSLSQKGIPLTIPIPEDPLLSFRNLWEIGEILNGEFLYGEENSRQPVGRMTVGPTDLKNELLILKRVYNKIILLKPRSSGRKIADTSARRTVAGILLTGGRNPPSQVLQAAKKANVPLMLVKADTFSALARLEQTPPRLSAKDEAKARRFTALLDQGGMFERLIRSLGLFPA
jgi:BioD-like phosphotransacetylase family protein